MMVGIILFFSILIMDAKEPGRHDATFSEVAVEAFHFDQEKEYPLIIDENTDSSETVDEVFYVRGQGESLGMVHLDYVQDGSIESIEVPVTSIDFVLIDDDSPSSIKFNLNLIEDPFPGATAIVTPEYKKILLPRQFENSNIADFFEYTFKENANLKIIEVKVAKEDLGHTLQGFLQDFALS